LKKLILLVTAVAVLAGPGFAQYQPRVFNVEMDFFVQDHDIRLVEIGQCASWLPTNLPRKVQVGNHWWNAGDLYIPADWPIPNHDLGLGLWFGWYLHRANRSLNRPASEQIEALPVPEPVKKCFLEQKISASIRTGRLEPGTLVSAMAFVSRGKLLAPENCIWLGKEDLNVHLYPLVQFESWVYQLGFVFDCNNHFYLKWKLQEKIARQVEQPVQVGSPVDTPVVVAKVPVPATPAKKDWKPNYFYSWFYTGIGRNWVEFPQDGIEYTWQYAGLDIQFLPVHWLSLDAKAFWLRSEDGYWGVSNKTQRYMAGFGLHSIHGYVRTMLGRDYKPEAGWQSYLVAEQTLELRPLHRTAVRAIGVYNNRPGTDWDHLWSQAEACYAIAIAKGNVRKLWLGGQFTWTGHPYWERALRGKKQIPDYTTCSEMVVEAEFGQQRDIAIKLSGGRGSRSVGWCGSITATINLVAGLRRFF